MKNTVSLSTFYKAVGIVAQALGKAQLMPSLGCFIFKPGSVVAYNNAQAIRYTANGLGELDAMVMGAPLIGFLNSVAKREEIIVIDEKGKVTFKVGSSKLSLDKLDESTHPYTEDLFYEEDDDDVVVVAEVGREFISGVDLCFPSANKDPSRPSQMGVTFFAGPLGSGLFSTDTITIASFFIGSLLVDFPVGVLLPAQFCTMLRPSPFDDSPKMRFKEESFIIEGKSGDDTVEIFSHYSPSLSLPDFTTTLAEFDTNERVTIAIPDGFKEAIKRAQSVAYTGYSEQYATRIRVAGECLSLTTKNQFSEIHDEFEIPPVDNEIVRSVDPKVLVRMIDFASELVLFPYKPNVVMLESEVLGFQHLIACVAEREEEKTEEKSPKPRKRAKAPADDEEDDIPF